MYEKKDPIRRILLWYLMDLETTMLEEKVELLRKRLKRRNLLLDETRKAYLRDVVAVNEAMRRSEVPQASTTTNSSSLDLRSTLELYAPSECSFRVAHGGKLDDFGGHIEIIHRESAKVVGLRKKVEELIELEQEMRIKATELELLQQKDQLALVDQREQNRDDRNILSREISSLKRRLEEIDEGELVSLRRENAKLRKSAEDAESMRRDNQELVDELRRTREARDRFELQCKGKDLRVRESESALQEATDQAREEVSRYNQLEAKYTQVREEKEWTKDKLDAANRDTREIRRNLSETVENLHRARKVEVELRQELADLKAEFTEAREFEEQEQERLRDLASELRRDTAKAKKDADEAKQALTQEKERSVLAMQKLRDETISELECSHAEKLKVALRDQLRSKAVAGAQAALLDSVKDTLKKDESTLRRHVEENDKSSATTIVSSASSSSATSHNTCTSPPEQSNHKELVTALEDATHDIADIQSKLDMLSLVNEAQSAPGADNVAGPQLPNKKNECNHVSWDASKAVAVTERAASSLLVAKLRAQIVSLEEDLRAARKKTKEMTASKEDARVGQSLLAQSEQKDSQDLSQALSLVEVLQDLSSSSAPEAKSELEDFAQENQFLTQESLQSGSDTGKIQIETLHRAGKLEQAMKLIKLRIATELNRDTREVAEKENRNSTKNAASNAAPAAPERTIGGPPVALPSLLRRASTMPSDMAAGESDQVAALRSELMLMKGEVFNANAIKLNFDELDKKHKRTEKRVVELRFENQALRLDVERLEKLRVSADDTLASVCTEKAVLDSERRESLQSISNLQGELRRVQSGLDDVIKKERIRLATNTSIQTQFTPHLCSVGIQTTFQTPNMTLRRINSFSYVPHRRCGPLVVTPAIDDDKPPESTPLFVKPDASLRNIFREKRQGPFGLDQTPFRRRSEDDGQGLLPTLLNREIKSR